MIKTMMAAAILLSAGAQVFASSDSAWNALYAKANGTCIGQSGLNTPEASAPVVFDDSVGKVAILLKGETGRSKAKTSVNLICLYDKKTGKASIEEYRWLGK
ncbi:hypothetical protein HFN01_32385 [Rhizobium leguminosarum]|uniref:hypothetical protein n=1 Tax=Rhizobium leguminosarum TaxID=384 RepID=UPI001C97407D|nr:hypothetical protein [Rhizobium leguminosarum]MBY5399501.1 hypothetical protein [Rhizobium leguminosarum]